MNDPNGPFYDDVHGVYHLFYQDHLAVSGGRGPVWGHAVSRDFAHWAHLPVAIWNDQWYDNQAIFSGSTTIVDGKPKIVYPGLCRRGVDPGCGTGATYAVAVPADPSDPLYRKWIKPAYNPILNNTGEDPSTAWRSPHGEWRMLGNSLSGKFAPMFASADFVHWHKVGDTSLPSNECPTFFPLPPLTLGAERAFDGLDGASVMPALPTHVYKYGCRMAGQYINDCAQLGTWTDGVPGSVGTWNATPGVPSGPRRIDKGYFYASKDFWDPVGGRRVLWGWTLFAPVDVQSLAREVTYDPRLGQLVFSPVSEQASLRGDVLASLGRTSLDSAEVRSLGKWPQEVGGSSEVVAIFPIPRRPTRFGVHVMAGSRESGLLVFVDFRHVTHSSVRDGLFAVEVGVASPCRYQREMSETDMPGLEYNAMKMSNLSFEECQVACDVDAKCDAWTHHAQGKHAALCVLKRGFPVPVPSAGMMCGVKDPSRAPRESGKKNDTLLLLPTDRLLEIRIFVDGRVVEAYFQGGRVAMTAGVAPTSEVGMALFTDAPLFVESTTVWRVSEIWVSPEEVLATPRRDGRPLDSALFV